MNTETQTPRLESAKMRLIDANALKEIIGCGALYFIDEIFEIIDSAPTVETTDDVMARLPLGVKVFKYDNGDGTFRIKATAHDCEKKYLNPWAYGQTPLKAVTRLEASLNQK